MDAKSAASRAVLIIITQHLEECSNPRFPIDDELQMQCIAAVSGEELGRERPVTAEEYRAVALAANLAQTLRQMFDAILNPNSEETGQ